MSMNIGIHLKEPGDQRIFREIVCIRYPWRLSTA